MKDIIAGIKNKLDDLRQNPATVFSLVYPYVLVIGIVVGIYYVKNMDVLSRQKVAPVIPDSTKVTDLPVKEARIVPPIDVLKMKNDNPDLLTEGEKLYKANCSSCHGENGAGGGPAAIGLNPAPRNFTSKDNWINGMKLSNIYSTLEEGIQGSAMVAYDYLLPEEKFALAHYIRKNFIPDPPSDTDDDLMSLDLTYNLSSGQQLPAQIPVAAAKQLVINETSLKLNEIENRLSSIKRSAESQGYKIFSNVSSNPKIAITFLNLNNEWKSNEQNFIDLVTGEVNTNGFNGKVFNLNADDWSALYSFILNNL